MHLEANNLYNLNMYEVGVQCIIQIDSQKICTPFNEYFVSSYNIYAYLMYFIVCAFSFVQCVA